MLSSCFSLLIRYKWFQNECEVFLLNVWQNCCNWEVNVFLDRWTVEKTKQPELSAISQSMQTLCKIIPSTEKGQSRMDLFFECSEGWNNNCAFSFFLIFSTPIFFFFFFFFYLCNFLFFLQKAEWLYYPFGVERVYFNEYYLSTQSLSHFIQT